MKLVKAGDIKPTGGTKRDPIVADAMEVWDLIQQQHATATLGDGEWENFSDDDDEEVCIFQFADNLHKNR